MTLTLNDISNELKNIDFGMLSTKKADGTISSRPMSNNGDVDYRGTPGSFALSSHKKSPRSRQIRR